MPIRLVAFDLDGTLVDSVPDIATAVIQTLRELDLPPLEPGAVRQMVGNGVIRLLKRVLTGERMGEPDPAQLAKALGHFRRAYAQHLCVESKLYPGVQATLDALGGRAALACITNKSTEFTEPLLQALGIRDHFGLVVCGDSLPVMKPDPQPLLHAAVQFDFTPDVCCMVGDSRNDIEAARAAQFRAVAVSYGYRQGEDLLALGADVQFDSMPELLPWLEGLGLAGPAASR
ncbi:MAG TPA: phosphoglycolate phosphatase [Gammaproteobacteria bacterium]|nr:phosphoglycolate phosphatase [Gammaproteobacteria bacterium]